jgi:hypothetical protein
MKMKLGFGELLPAQLTVNGEEVDPSIFLGLLFLFTASALLLVAVIRIKSGRASKTWPATKGTILESYNQHKTFTIRLIGSNTGRKYVPYIQYKYEVNGREYQSSSINSAPSWWVPPGVSHRLAKYPQDKNVDVYYNPQSPEKAFLEPGVESLSFVFSLLGVIALIISIWFFLGGGL